MKKRIALLVLSFFAVICVAQVLAAAMKRGVLVIFSPSSVANFYRDSPQRKAVLVTPVCKEYEYPAVAIYKGFPPLPPFANTGGCECPDRNCRQADVWTRQNKDLIIGPDDLIVEGNDKGELFNVCKARGLTMRISRGPDDLHLGVRV